MNVYLIFLLFVVVNARLAEIRNHNIEEITDVYKKVDVSHTRNILNSLINTQSHMKMINMEPVILKKVLLKRKIFQMKRDLFIQMNVNVVILISLNIRKKII